MKMPALVETTPIGDLPDDLVLAPHYDETLRRWRMEHPGRYLPGEDLAEEPREAMPKPTAPRRRRKGGAAAPRKAALKAEPTRGLGQVQVRR